MSETSPAPELSGSFLLFHLGESLLAFEARFLWEISTRAPFSRIPKNSSHLMGITHLRGKIIPVVDLAGMLGSPSPGPGTLVAARPEKAGAVGGFYVSRVLGFERFPVVRAPGPAEGLELGWTEMDGKAVRLLDLERLWSRLRKEPARLAG